MRFKFKRENYIPKGAVIKVADKQSDAVAYLYERVGVPYAMGFCGKRDKPDFNYRFKSVIHRERHIKRHFEDRRAAMKRTEERRAETVKYQHSCQAGDIYRTSWGYDQTNVEFFQVVEVKGKYAILREIASHAEDGSMGTEKCVAQSEAFLTPRYEGDERGQPIRRLIQDGRIKIDNVRTGWPWGNRVAGVVVGPAQQRTAAGWGH